MFSILTKKEGTQIEVVGQVNSGQDPVVANYTIDDSSPTNRGEVGVDQSSSIDSETFFASPEVEYGSHTLNVTVLQTGRDRNYVIWYFAIFNGTASIGGSNQTSSAVPFPSGTGRATDDTATSDARNSDTAAILGGTLGGLLFVAVILLCFLLYKQRVRNAQGMLWSANHASCSLMIVSCFHYST